MGHGRDVRERRRGTRLSDLVVQSAKAEHRVDLVVGERPVRRRHRAQHVAVQADLVKRDGVVESVIKVFAHRSTSVACRIPILTAARLRAGTSVPHDPSGSFLVILTDEPDDQCATPVG